MSAGGYADTFWEHRPLWAGGEFSLFPTTYEEASVDLWWHIAAGGAYHGLGLAAGGSGMSPLRS